MSDFDNLLKYDPLEHAEKIAAEGGDAQQIGVGLHLIHNANLRNELALRDDTYYGSPWSDYKRVVDELGFKTEFFNIHTTEEGEVEEEIIYVREDGLLIHAESSRGKVVNSSTIYFNLQVSDRAMVWALPVSGHFHTQSYDEGKWIWVGNIDGRVALRHHLARLEGIGTPLREWVEAGHLWLLNYAESSSISDAADSRERIDAINESKIATLPDWMQENLRKVEG